MRTEVTEMTISAETQDRAKDIIWRGLKAHFKGNVHFADIRASTMLDQDQDEFLNVLVVYDGNRNGLDARLCNSLYQEVRDQLVDVGLYTVPSISYVDKSDDGKQSDISASSGHISPA